MPETRPLAVNMFFMSMCTILVSIRKQGYAGYVAPCQTGSLASGGYTLDASGYFCTEPARTLYAEGSIYSGVNVSTYTLYEYPIHNTSAEDYQTEEQQYAHVKTQPCNCYGQKVQWKSEKLPFTANDDDVDAYLFKVQLQNNATLTPQWYPFDDGTPCVYTKLGYAWAISSESLPDPLMLTIPPGHTVNVVKTGSNTDTFMNGDASPVPCGVVARDVYQSAFVPPRTLTPGSGSNELDFYERTGSMPVSDYCAASRIVNTSDWATLSTTQRVFQATLVRLAGAMETVRQCHMGMPAALLLTSGFWPYQDATLTNTPFGLSNTPSFDNIATQIYATLGLTTYSRANSMLLCSGHSLLMATEQLVADMNRYIQQSVQHTIREYLRTKTNFSATQCTVTTAISTEPIRLFSEPVTIQKKTMTYTPGYNDIVTSNLIQYTRQGTIATLGAVPLFHTTPAGPDSDVTGFVCLDIFDKGAALVFVTTETLLTSACWDAFIAQTPTVWQLQEHSPSHGSAPFKSKTFPCNSDQAMHLILAADSECAAGPVGGGRWAFTYSNPAFGMLLQYKCVGYPTYDTVTVATGVPTTADMQTVDGRAHYTRQLNFIIAYYYEFSQLVQEPSLFTHFLTLVSQSSSVLPTTLWQADVQSITLPSDILIAHGVFQAAATDNAVLTFDTNTNTHLFNPFMPNGVTTNVSNCMPDASRWETSGNVLLNIAKPGQLTYFTANQIVETLGPLLSPNIATEPQAGFWANLLIFHAQMDFSEIVFPPIQTNTHNMIQLPESETLEALVGYTTTSLAPSVAFYTALLGETCSPPSTLMPPYYFAVRSQDLAGRPYDHVHLPMYNALVKTQFFFNRSIPTNITTGTPLVCLEYSSTTGPLLIEATNTTCIWQLDLDLQLGGGNDLPLHGNTIAPGHCRFTAHTVFCRCTATTLTPCNVPLTLPDIFMYMAQSDTVPERPFVRPDYSLVFIPTVAVPADLDTLHCMAKTTTHSQHYLEKPLFLNPEYTQTQSHLPPGLSQSQLTQWCQQFTLAECTGYNRSQLSFNLCMPINGNCTLRTFNYGALSSLPGDASIYNTTLSQCAHWDATLDDPWQCQHPDAFTGCVLIQTHDVRGNWSLSSASALTGTSLRIPNTHERLVQTTPRTQYLYYDQMHSVVFTRDTDTDRDYGTCACRYTTQSGTRATLNIAVHTAYTALNMTAYTLAIPNIARNPHWFRHLVTVTLPTPGITVRIPTAASIKYQPDTVLDYTRTALRCDCTDPELHLAPQAFAIVERQQPHYVFAGINTTNAQNTAALALACVPLNEKELFSQATGQTTAMSGALQRGRVYRTRPVDCNALAYASAAGLASIELFKTHCMDQLAEYGGLCTDTRENIGVSASCFFDSKWYANIGSSITLLTHWSTALSAAESVSAYFFSTGGSGSTAFSTTPGYCTNMATCTAAEFAGTQCTDTEQTCGLMMDKTFLDACSILAQTSIPACSKPQLQMVYPAFSNQRPDMLGGFVEFPFDIWKWNGGSAFTTVGGAATATTVLRNTVQRPIPANWEAQLTMVHYCDRYFGGFVYCDNDAMTQATRTRLCGPEYYASVVYVGTTLETFTLADICPFTFNPAFDRACFVFAGVHTYNSVDSILQALPHEIGDITFYYVPFALKVLQLLFMNGAFSDTLMTNTFNAEKADFITKDNVHTLSRNAQLLAKPLLAAMDTEPEYGAQYQQGICNRRLPLDRNMIAFYYNAIQANRNAQTGLYDFVTVNVALGLETQNTYHLTKADVFPPLTANNIHIDKPDITILPALPPTTYKLVFESTFNPTYMDCTRFIVYAPRFHIANVTFNQSACLTVTETSRQIPIVFTGAESAHSSRVEHLHIIDAPAATALYGGTALYGSTALFLDGDEFTTAAITMEYTQPSQSLTMRNNVAVFGKTVGTVITDALQSLDANLCNSRYCHCDWEDTTTPCSHLIYSTLTQQNDIAVCTRTGFTVNGTIPTFLQAWQYDTTLQINFQEQWVWSLADDLTVIVLPTHQAGIIFTRLTAEDNINRLGSAHFYRASVIDATLASAALVSATLKSTQLCLARNATTNRLYARSCFNIIGILEPGLAPFFVNSVSSRLHISGSPYMCPTVRLPNTTITPPVYMEPCTPCNIGMETPLPCPQTPNTTQWALTNTGVPQLTLHPTLPGECLTTNTTVTEYWSPCDPCLWAQERFAVGRSNRPLFQNWCTEAVGIQRYACLPMSTAGLYEIIHLPTGSATAFCQGTTGSRTILVNGSRFGLGARVLCHKNTLQITHHGYGYVSGDTITGYPQYVSETQKILIQPYAATGFNIANQGMQIINVSEYTNIFGKAYEAIIFTAPPQTKTLFVVLNIILGSINGVLIITHIGLVLYEHELKEKYASPAIT
jgi:hypothetical protein